LTDEWAGNHYTWHDRDIMDDNWDIILNPEQEHIPTDSGMEGESPYDAEEDGQLKIPFDFED
jgi:hypothetical protein